MQCTRRISYKRKYNQEWETASQHWEQEPDGSQPQHKTEHRTLKG